MLCWQERIFLREIFALFAVNPGLDFHREGAKHAKDFSLVAALPLSVHHVVSFLCSSCRRI